MTWQPIETAPKDAPWWLLWSSEYNRPVVAEKRADDGTFWEGDWDYLVQASHWMPVPALNQSEVPSEIHDAPPNP